MTIPDPRLEHICDLTLVLRERAAVAGGDDDLRWMVGNVAAHRTTMEDEGLPPLTTAEIAAILRAVATWARSTDLPGATLLEEQVPVVLAALGGDVPPGREREVEAVLEHLASGWAEMADAVQRVRALRDLLNG
jgi:hypothetical protein